MTHGVARRIANVGPLLALLAFGVIAAGGVLQWRLTHVSAHPQTVAYLGEEKRLVNSVREAAVGLLNWNDDKQARDRLREMRTAFDAWTSNHPKLVSVAEEPGIDAEVVETLKRRVFPRYEATTEAFERIFQLAAEEQAMSLAQLKPLVQEAESATSIYLFYLDHFDLQLADIARSKIESLRTIEGTVIIGAGLLLLVVVLWLVFPAAKALGRYQLQIDEMLDELRQKNTLLSELYFRVEKKAEHITDCLNMLAHEVRNPLATMAMGAELQDLALLDADGLDAEVQEKLAGTTAIIKRNVERATGTLDEFLEMARIESGLERPEVERVELRSFLARVEEQILPRAARRGLQFDMAIAEDCPADLLTDPDKLHRIIENLLSNALKYTDTGSVTLRAAPGGASESGRDVIEFVVEDTGIGIPEDAIDRLFEPFSTPNRREGSVGLGLAIARRLADALEGELAVESEPGRGSRFAVRIPRYPSSPEGRAGKGTPGRRAPADQQAEVVFALRANDKVKGLRVLLVEDSDELRDLTAEFLRAAGMSVRTATNGVEALRLLEPSQDPIDLVLMDIGLPEMDGIDALERIRERGVEAPVIALTSYASRGNRSEYLEAGFTDFMEKPVTPVSLSECLIRHAPGLA